MSPTYPGGVVFNLATSGMSSDCMKSPVAIPVIEPMKAVTDRLPSNPSGWAIEVKWDGIRAVVTTGGGMARITGKRGRDMTALFPEVAPLAALPELEDSVLDGELVAFRLDGRPSFSSIQRRLGSRVNPEAAGVKFVIFDLLFHHGEDLRRQPWSDRRERLDDLSLEGEAWRTPDYFTGDISPVLAATAEQGLEGIVVKRFDSPYRSGSRSRDWIKAKNLRRQEFVIGGWLPGKGSRRGTPGSLLLGYRSSPGVGEPLHYAGRVGSGLGQREIEDLRTLLDGLERLESPFSSTNLPPGARFTDPALVCEVRFSEWTPGDHLRHPVWLGLRQDSDPARVVREGAPWAPGPSPRKPCRSASGSKSKWMVVRFAFRTSTGSFIRAQGSPRRI